jgi:3-dehydroquinate dehydratase-1
MKSIRLHGQPVGAHPLICTPIVSKTRAALLDELATVVVKRPDLIEWRVDFFDDIGNTDAVIDAARRIKTAAGAIPITFTCRSINEGGERIVLSEAETVKLYVAVCASRGVDIIDYELSNLTSNLERIRKASRDNDVSMIMSYHNFQFTPDPAVLSAKFIDAEQLGADIAKLAVMPRTPEDVLTLLGVTWRASETSGIPLIGLSMGAIGSLSRMVGGIFGSAVTYAVGKASSAPGMIPIEELRTVLATVRNAAAGS